MSTRVFPTLPGISWPVVRTAQWSSGVNESVSGKRTSIQYWSYPRWRWQISFDMLRSDSVNLEFQELAAFFNLVQGAFDTWLYTDAEDYTVTGQLLGVGDGSTSTFQLLRSLLDEFVEPVLAPNTITAVYLNGVVQSASAYSVQEWDDDAPGLLTFTAAPTVGVEVTADFTFYWPCRFDDDKMDFSRFMQNLYEMRAVSFSSEK